MDQQPEPKEALVTAIGARDFGPEKVVVWGYNLYISEVAEKEGKLRHSAEEVVDRFTALAASFPVTSAEGLYVLDLQSAANALARGIQRRKESHLRNIALAEQRKTWLIDRVRQRETSWGFLQGAWKSIAMGGVAYALVQLLYLLPLLQAHTRGQEHSYASLATGLAVALASAWWRGRTVAQVIDSVIADYQNALNLENQAYSQGVVEEVTFATQTAARSWTKLTGQAVDIGEAYGSLIAHVLTVGEDVHNTKA